MRGKCDVYLENYSRVRKISSAWMLRWVALAFGWNAWLGESGICCWLASSKNVVISCSYVSMK